jgi:uncharacterized membrane protein YphA (DoxX/SURF4 family)
MVLTTVCRYLLAAVFLMAALTKITEPEAFREQALHKAQLPPALATAVAHCLPWLELTCGACLALGYAVREAALIVALLLTGFLVHALVNHAEPDCGCFLVPLPQPALAPWWPPTRNAILLMCAVRVMWSDSSVRARLPGANR